MTTQEKREQEKQTVDLMIQIYCHGNHHTKGWELCSACSSHFETEADCRSKEIEKRAKRRERCFTKDF